MAISLKKLIENPDIQKSLIPKRNRPRTTPDGYMKK